MIPGILKTQQEAREHAKVMANIIQEPMCVFPVPERTMAYSMGFRFGTCRASERADYEKDGATILETVQPDN